MSADNTVYSPSNQNSVQGVSIDNTRRMFNFGERVAELAPQQSPFFVYLAKVAKKATDDPVFKFLEQRHQWQRRNIQLAGMNAIGTDLTGLTTAVGAALGGSADLHLSCFVDDYGSISSTAKPCKFLVGGLTFQLAADDGNIHTFQIKETCLELGAAVGGGTTGFYHDSTATEVAGEDVVYLGAIDGGAALVSGDNFVGNATKDVGAKGTVMGSAWAEGTEAPQGWEDKLYDREGYCQIFKTAINLFSGTSLATRYRGINNEFQRVWQEKLMEHKMDIEQSMLFGQGKVTSSGTPAMETAGSTRYSWGVLPYTYQYGKIYNLSYASSGYDAFLDAMEDYFAPESGNSGNKLVLASRKVISYLNKLGAGSFLNNSVGSSQYRLDIANVPGAFGHNVTVVNTIFGNLHFVAEPLLRGAYEDYCVCVDMKNVAYRPLVGNGISRDTYIETNIQGNAVDGRQDQIITEAGLEISLPETHAILKFS